MNPVERLARRADAFQQRHGVVAAGFGVVKKFGDDRAGALAGLLAYYGFLALFPLLLHWSPSWALSWAGAPASSEQCCTPR